MIDTTHHSKKSQPDYDVFVVGSGAAPAITAYALAMDGAKVLVLEAGRNFTPATEHPRTRSFSRRGIVQIAMIVLLRWIGPNRMEMSASLIACRRSHRIRAKKPLTVEVNQMIGRFGDPDIGFPCDFLLKSGKGGSIRKRCYKHQPFL